MPPVFDPPDGAARQPRRQLRAMRAIVAVLVLALVVLTFGYFAGLGDSGSVRAAEPAAAGSPGPSTATAADPSTTTAPSTTTTTTTTTTSTSTSTTSTTVPSSRPPAHEARYVVPLSEAEPEAKQVAVDIAYALTTYEMDDDHQARLELLAGPSGVDLLAEASTPLIHQGSWSRGQVIYPQMGGLKNERASVMVVTRQTVGTGAEADFSVVRTLDIRLARGDAGWEFDALSSAGGTFDDLTDLALAHAVADDRRIEMPDSARLDIRSGLVSPVLLRVMADLADQTPYAVVVAATGHPYHVFETDRVSHHSIGRAIDISRVGDRLVIDDREPGSATSALVQWLYDHPDVAQVGSPWDIDGSESRRSFTDAVHQDHIHLAVNGS